MQKERESYCKKKKKNPFFLSFIHSICLSIYLLFSWKLGRWDPRASTSIAIAMIVHYLLCSVFTFFLLPAHAQPSSPNPPLRLLVPVKKGFQQFVSFDNNTRAVNGFAVNVFLSALRSRFPANAPNYTFIPFINSTDPSHTPSYTAMVQMVHDGGADAVVADLTITGKRMESVDFTMPYIVSGLAMVTKFRYGAKGTFWDFLRPFSIQLWLALFFSFIITSFVLLFLEKNNPDFFANPQMPTNKEASNDHTEASTNKRPCNNCGVPNALWFTSLCVFMAQQSYVKTHMGRVVTVSWLFAMLIFNSSYTANLASMLSANEKFPLYNNLQKLRSDTNAYVGYQDGSFMYQKLQDMGLPQNRLRGYSSALDFAKALKLGSAQGGVDAIIDELPYMQVLVQNDCGLTIVDHELTSLGGFGFAFKTNSNLTKEISKGILSLAENGDLVKLRHFWIEDENDDECGETKSPEHLRLASFRGLFIILVVVYATSFTWRFCSGFCTHDKIQTSPCSGQPNADNNHSETECKGQEMKLMDEI